MDSAWLEWNGQLYFSEVRRSLYEPHSAVTQLISGIWQQFPGSAHFILRARIFLNYEPTELCRGMMIVCAKRFTRLPSVPVSVSSRIRGGDKAAIVIDPHFFCESSQSSGVRFSTDIAEQNRSIEAWLLDAAGRLVGWGVNTAGRNRTSHAEMNLLRGWWFKNRCPLPAGGRLISTLEPCPMCAGAIVHCLESQSNFRIEYLNADRGALMRRSILRNSPILQQCKIPEHSFSSQDS
jgi:hypothetical protein